MYRVKKPGGDNWRRYGTLFNIVARKILSKYTWFELKEWITADHIRPSCVISR